MGVSQAVVTTTSMELTPARVTFDGVDLGGTLGNVVIKPVFAKNGEIKSDQTGSDTVLDRRVTGTSCTVETIINRCGVMRRPDSRRIVAVSVSQPIRSLLPKPVAGNLCSCNYMQ